MGSPPDVAQNETVKSAEPTRNPRDRRGAARRQKGGEEFTKGSKKELRIRRKERKLNGEVGEKL
jgi:hypothetical protein